MNIINVTCNKCNHKFKIKEDERITMSCVKCGNNYFKFDRNVYVHCFNDCKPDFVVKRGDSVLLNHERHCYHKFYCIKSFNNV